MNWEVVNALGEVAGALGVIATLLYLSRQINENTRFSKLSTVNETMNKFIDLGMAASENRETMGTMLRGLNDPESLDEVDFAIFTHRVAATFMTWFNTFVQYQGGLLDRDYWETCERDIVGFFRFQGIRRVWPEIKPTFTPQFVELIETLSNTELESVSNYFLARRG